MELQNLESAADLALLGFTLTIIGFAIFGYIGIKLGVFR